VRRASGAARRGLFLALLVAASGFLLLGGLLAATLSWASFGWPEALAVGGLGLALASLWALLTLADGHFDDLERLTGDVLGAQDAGLLPARWADRQAFDLECRRLAEAVNLALASQRGRGGEPDARLAAVVSAVGEGLVTVTDSGLVSLVNAAGAAAFPRPATLGTSLYGLVHRDSLAAAEAAALAAGGTAEVRLALVDGGSLTVRATLLGEHGGLVLNLPATASGGPLLHDLTLHDRPLPAPATPETPLARLPVAVLDGETTGLAVDSDRLVSLAAIRLQGARLYRHLSLDLLVNPGVPIPRAATAVHGISNRMVEGAGDAGRALRAVAGFVEGCVVVGHNIGFDLALLAAEASRAGLAWSMPAALDTGHLAAALDPALTDLNLETLAARYAIEVEGRHTALGDCLVTAAVWQRLLRELEARGIATLAAAQAFARRAERLIRLQRQAGWVVPD